MDMAKDNSKEAVDPKLAAMYAKLDAKRAQAEADIEQVEFDIEKMTMDFVQRYLDGHAIDARRKQQDYALLHKLMAEIVISAPESWGDTSDPATYSGLNMIMWRKLDFRMQQVMNYVTSKN
jgi:hypothetical protein